MGVLQNYPVGVPDTFEYITLEKGKASSWKKLKIDGTWFPHAFMGSMAEIMKAVEGTTASLDNSVEDGIYTMRCVEAAYLSDKNGGTILSSIL